MKRKKLLRKLADILGTEGRKQRKHSDELKALLRKLKKKEVELEIEMRREKDERKQKRLGKELEIVKAQRAKGVKTLKEIEAG
jgi:hypothetical protein